MLLNSPISTKVYNKYCSHWGIQVITCWRSAQNWKYYGIMGPCVAGNFNTLLLVHFSPLSAKVCEDIGYHVRINAITFLGDWPSLKNLWNFNMEEWENLKMLNILKTADHRAKGIQMWDSSYELHIYRVLFMSDSLISVWGHSVHFSKFPMLRFSKGYCSQFSSYFNQTLWKVS